MSLSRWRSSPATCITSRTRWRPHTTPPPRSWPWGRGSGTSSSGVRLPFSWAETAAGSPQKIGSVVLIQPEGGSPSWQSSACLGRWTPQLTALLLPLRSAPGQAVAAAEGHGGGAEPTPGGDRKNGGQAERADSAAGAGERMSCPLGTGRMDDASPVGDPWFGACEWHLSLPCAWTRSGGGRQQSNPRWNRCSTHWRSSGE